MLFLRRSIPLQLAMLLALGLCGAAAAAAAANGAPMRSTVIQVPISGGSVAVDAIFRRVVATDSVGFDVRAGGAGYHIVWQGDGGVVAYVVLKGQMTVASVGTSATPDTRAHVLSLRIVPRGDSNDVYLFVDDRRLLLFNDMRVPIRGESVVVATVHSRPDDGVHSLDVRVAP